MDFSIYSYIFEYTTGFMYVQYKRTFKFEMCRESLKKRSIVQRDIFAK